MQRFFGPIKAAGKCGSPSGSRAGGWTLFVLLLGSVVGTGCASPTVQRQVPESQKPLFVYLPGIEGVTKVDTWWLGGLRDGGLDAHVETINWTGPRTGIAALQAYRENHISAGKVAERITREARLSPSRRIILSATSGGTGVAVWALEQLPADVQVHTLLLTAPALSPNYDLTAALRHVHDHADVFYSDGDTLILGDGTRTFGTIDGVHCAAAGLVGFRKPPTADSQQYQKLRSYAYRSEWTEYGNFGDHSGTLARPFAEHVIAPLLRQAASQSAPAPGNYF